MEQAKEEMKKNNPNITAPKIEKIWFSADQHGFIILLMMTSWLIINKNPFLKSIFYEKMESLMEKLTYRFLVF